ncbi:MAG: hypothetical protein ACKVOR_04635, partial [Flavobacteriales bacterium]
MGNLFLNDLVLVHVNSDGTESEIIDEDLWNNYSLNIQAMLTDNGKIICAGAIRESEELHTRYALWKLDDNGELLWTSPIGEYPESNIGFHSFHTIVKVSDGNYVGTADSYEYTDGPHWEVRVIKTDSIDGGLIWDRAYHFVESQSDTHDVIDLKATPDGGVVFCGDASDAWSQNPDLELPAQQGWIVKLDACGCLVPGCDINCVVGLEELGVEPLGFFKVGPNPARDYINIYLRLTPTLSGGEGAAYPTTSTFDIQNSTFVIHDMNG